jgi:hypothetical protein
MILGVRQGATENATVVGELLGDLVSRGLDFTELPRPKPAASRPSPKFVDILHEDKDFVVIASPRA